MATNRILEVLAMAELYHRRPSDIMGLTDPYVRFCFDEALAFIELKRRGGEEPIFPQPGEEPGPVHVKYNSVTDLYKAYGIE